MRTLLALLLSTVGLLAQYPTFQSFGTNDFRPAPPYMYLANPLHGVVDVSSLPGIDTTGATNASAIIQSSVNSHTSDTVFDFGWKTYKLTSAIVIPSTARAISFRNGLFVTSNNGVFTVSTNSGSPYAALFLDFHDLILNCQAHTSSDIPIINLTRASQSWVSQCQFYGVTGKTIGVLGLGEGHGEGPYYNVVTKSYFGGFHYGLLLGTFGASELLAANSWTISDNRIQPGTGNYAIYIEKSCHNIRVLGNTVESVGGIGTYCDGEGNTILGNYYEGLDHHIQVLNNNGNTAHFVYGNTFSGGPLQPVELFGAAVTNVLQLANVSNYDLYMTRGVASFPGVMQIHSPQISQSPSTGAEIIDGGLGVGERISAQGIVHSITGIQAGGSSLTGVGTNSMCYTTGLGNTIQGAVGGSTDMAFLSADGSFITAQNNTGTHNWQFNATTANLGDTNSGAVTMAGGMGVGGDATFGGQVRVLGGAGGQATFAKDATFGTRLQAAASSGYEFSIIDKAGTNATVRIPNGTHNIEVTGGGTFGGALDVTGTGATITVRPAASGGSSVLKFEDQSIGSARGSVGVATGDTNLTVTANNGGVITSLEGDATWMVGTNVVAKIAKASGYSGTGTNALTDDGTFKPMGTASATNVIWSQILGVITNQTEFAALTDTHVPYFNGNKFYDTPVENTANGLESLTNLFIGQNAGFWWAPSANELDLITKGDYTNGVRNVNLGVYEHYTANGANPAVYGEMRGNLLDTNAPNMLLNLGVTDTSSRDTKLALNTSGAGSSATVWWLQGTNALDIEFSGTADNGGLTPLVLNTPVSMASGNLMELKNKGVTQFLLSANSGYDGSGTHFLSDDGTYKAGTGGGANVCVGTSTNYLLYYDGTCITNSQVNVTTNGISVPEVNTPSIVVSNLNDGVIVGISHTLTNVPPAVGYFHYDGTNYGWSASPVTVTSGITNFVAAGDYSTTDSWADVVFGTSTFQTPTLGAGTYLVTVMVQYLQYRTLGQQVHIKLYATEGVGSDVTGSERWTGPDVNSAGFAGEWPITLQTVVTVSSSGRFKVMAYNGVAGDTNSSIRSNESTISWIKIN